MSNKAAKRMSYPVSNKVISPSNEPNLEQVYTVNWDRPNGNLERATKLMDGENHRIPRGDGMVKRLARRMG